MSHFWRDSCVTVVQPSNHAYDQSGLLLRGQYLQRDIHHKSLLHMLAQWSAQLRSSSTGGQRLLRSISPWQLRYVRGQVIFAFVLARRGCVMNSTEIYWWRDTVFSSSPPFRRTQKFCLFCWYESFSSLFRYLAKIRASIYLHAHFTSSFGPPNKYC